MSKSESTAQDPAVTPMTMPAKLREHVAKVAAAFGTYDAADKQYKQVEEQLVVAGDERAKQEVNLARFVALLSREAERVGFKFLTAVRGDEETPGIPERFADSTVYNWRTSGETSLRLDTLGVSHAGIGQGTLLSFGGSLSDADLKLAYARAIGLKGTRGLAEKSKKVIPTRKQVQDAKLSLTTSDDPPTPSEGSGPNGSTPSQGRGRARASSAPSNEVSLAADEAQVKAATTDLGRIFTGAVKTFELKPERMADLENLVVTIAQACKDHSPEAVLLAIGSIRDAKASAAAAK